ncbi:MAG TPA: folylpolyglutamate synthase/dihydrofolate synthase family protein [Acidobacteriaceae bacterium]
MSYAAALDSLHLRAGELHAAPGAPRRKFRIEEMQTLVEALGHPERRFRSILIAGTNGKGSTAATLASILQAAGLRTGLYTSPHLIRVNERIRVDGEAISDDDFARDYFRVDDCANRLVAAGTLPASPSFFEALTALAFEAFAEASIDIAVLEVGMGGRLDATNVVDPLLSVITDISLDHTEWLGDTIPLIAREKAGILRRNGTLITLPQHPEANQAIGEVAVVLDVRAVNAAEYVPSVQGSAFSVQDFEIPSDFSAERVVRSTAWPEPAEGTTVDGEPVPSEAEGAFGPGTDDPGRKGASAPGAGLRGLRNRYPLQVFGATVQVDSPLWGEHQRRNLALAIAAAVELRNHHGYTITAAQIERGIRSTQWPGRLELFTLPVPANAERCTLNAVLLDVAHNPAGVWTLRAALSALEQSSLPGSCVSLGNGPVPAPLNAEGCTLNAVLVFGCLRDKAIAQMAQILFPLFDRVIVTPVASPRSATGDELLAAAAPTGVPAVGAPDAIHALERAGAEAPPDGLIVVAGSVYLVGEIREYLLVHGASATGGA